MSQGEFRKVGWVWTKTGWKRAPKRLAAVKKAPMPRATWLMPTLRISATPYRGSSPGRWGCYHPHPPQTRTCGFPASGSSQERFAPDGAFVGDLFDHPSDDAGRDSLVEEGGRPQSIWLSVVGSWTGSRGPESPRLFQANGSLLMAPPFPPSGPASPVPRFHR